MVKVSSRSGISGDNETGVSGGDLPGGSSGGVMGYSQGGSGSVSSLLHSGVTGAGTFGVDGKGGSVELFPSGGPSFGVSVGGVSGGVVPVEFNRGGGVPEKIVQDVPRFVFVPESGLSGDIGSVSVPQKVSGSGGVEAPSRVSSLSFEALEGLEFTFTDPKTGKSITSWAIYAEPDDPGNPAGTYHQVEAPGEGFGCVDDVARVGLVYLDHYQKTNDPVSLDKAKKAIEFCMYMSNGEGEFYNFVEKDGTINKEGHTSKAGMDWWTARSMYVLGKGINVIGNSDPAFTEKMKSVFDLTVDKLVHLRENPEINPVVKPVYEKLGITPGTLVGDSGTVTSICVLGLLERYKSDKDPRSEKLIRDYCDAMTKCCEKSDSKYPFQGYHYNSLWDTDLVDFYGNRQVQALASAGKEFGEERWVASAEREVDRAYPRLMSSWGAAFGLSPDPEIYPQISYTVETLTTNLMSVHEATGKEKYAALAGLTSSWYFGNNPVGKPVHLPEQGRTFDGIDVNGVNKNSGAESNIETLLAFQSMGDSRAQDYLHFMPVGDRDRQPRVLFTGSMSQVSGPVSREKRTLSGGAVEEILVLGSSGSVTDRIEIPQGGKHRVYLNYRSSGEGETGVLQASLKGRELTVPIIHSGEDYHYRSVPLGSTEVHGGGAVDLSIGNPREGAEVRLSSVVVQPDLQTKSWSSGGRKITMAVNTSPDALILPPDLQGSSESPTRVLYAGEGVKRGVLPPGTWVLLEHK